MTSGIYEFDEMGRCLFRPHVPAFPSMDRVHDLLDPTLVALREFDRRMTALDRRGAIGRLFARLDAVHSSGAEGSTTTFTDLMEYESALRVAPDADDAATVAAAAAGLDENLEHGDLERLVLRIHRRIFEGSKDKMIASEAGKMKRSPNFVRDSEEPAGLFGYTHPNAVKDAIKEWQAFTIKEDGATHELIRQILSHWMFEHIHPVPDGNGRIGRLLVPIVSKAKGLTTTACAFFGEAVHEDKALYIDALKDARLSGETTIFVRQMLSFLRRTATVNLERLDRLREIEADWNRRFVHVRSSSIVHRLTNYAVTKPVFTVRDVEKDLSVSFAAANTAVRALSEEGIVSVPNDARRDRLFHADEVLEVFDRFRTPLPTPSMS
jgi:cell filamentation protein, protein adenylyltransferase